MLLIPLTTAMNYYGHRRSMNFLIEAHDRKTYEDTIEQVTDDPSGGLGGDWSGDLFGRRDYFWLLPRLESRQPRPH